MILKSLILCLALLSPDLRETVEQLTMESRDTSSESINRAQDYIIRECKKLGLQVESQGMLVRGKECRNIVAWREGKDPNKVVVIGAHLDSIYNPGANDNASGSACVLDLAKRFTRKPKYTVAFHWYTGEEQGLLGSKFYAKYPILPKDDPDIKKHVFMLNFDMVGRLKYRPKDEIDEVLIGLFKKYPFAEDITYRTGARSDHKSFVTKGVPVVWLHTGADRENYHQKTDTAEKLNYAGMAMICEYAFDLVIKFMDDEIPDYILWQLPELER